MSRLVILTDASGKPTGTMEVVQAHTGAGALHKAFSVYVFSPKRKSMLIQRRSDKKMLWPGYWANTCCSHPFENEAPVAAGMRRLQEELGLSCNLTAHSDFVYRAEDPSSKGIEHEHVTILIGQAEEDARLQPDPDEVSTWKWVPIEQLTQDMRANPNIYAPWFHIGLKHILTQTHS